MGRSPHVINSSGAPLLQEEEEETSCQEDVVPQDPLPLTPLHPLPQALRLYHRVQGSKGGRIRTRRVLQSSATTTTTGMDHDSTSPRCYAIDSALTQQSKTGVTLLLATPCRYLEAAATPPPTTTTPMSPLTITPDDPILVSCGPQVVIKAVPQPTNAARAYADDPLAEIAAMQLLLQQHHQ